jgi:hypothetical protein
MGEGPEKPIGIGQAFQIVALHHVHPVQRANLRMQIIPEQRESRGVVHCDVLPLLSSVVEYREHCLRKLTELRARTGGRIGGG